MSPYRRKLPQLADRPFLADSGLETTLIFHDGYDLPHFASFVLLESEAGRARLASYFAEHVRLALDARTGIVLETPTWRASADWGEKLGFDAARLDAVNRRAVAQLVELRNAAQTPATPIVISGNLGPRGDGYRADARMSADAAIQPRLVAQPAQPGHPAPARPASNPMGPDFDYAAEFKKLDYAA
jgi:homocysteine S-methyltransferase